MGVAARGRVGAPAVVGLVRARGLAAAMALVARMVRVTALAVLGRRKAVAIRVLG
jgi:hypothetical protein